MLNPTWPEISLLVIAVCISLLIFYRRITPVIRTILKSRHDPGWQLDPVSKRIKDFVWEVLLQGKVIKERPLPGLAHAFVFWGFCAFALVTLNHFSEGAGFELFSRTSVLGKFYSVFAGVFAVAVLVSIIALAIRRF